MLTTRRHCIARTRPSFLFILKCLLRIKEYSCLCKYCYYLFVVMILAYSFSLTDFRNELVL